MSMIDARSLLARLREYVGNRRRGHRRGARFTARVTAAVTLLDAGEEAMSGTGHTSPVEGETKDIGPAGLTVRVGRIRVGGRYLTDSEYHLGVRLELPAGEVYLLTRVVRFEQSDEGGAGGGYLLGLRILKMREEDHAVYAGFMRTLEPMGRRRSDRDPARSESLRLFAAGAVMAVRDEVLKHEEITRAFERFGGGGTGRGR